MSERIRNNWKVLIGLALFLLLAFAAVPLARRDGQRNDAQPTVIFEELENEDEPLAAVEVPSVEGTPESPESSPEAGGLATVAPSETPAAFDGVPEQGRFSAARPPSGLSEKEWRGMLRQVAVEGSGRGRGESASLVKILKPGDGVNFDQFGYSCALFGDVAIVGAIKATVGGELQKGAAYVFYRNQGGTGNWGLVKKITTAVEGVSWFGFSAAIWGDTAVVGSGVGARAFIYQRNRGGADNWGEVKELEGVASSNFGRAVAVCRDTVVVGSQYTAGGEWGAYVFYRNQGGADNWGSVKKILPSDPEADGGGFGYSVAIDGENIVVGSDGDDILGRVSQGSAYLFSRNYGGADNWGQRKKLTASDGAAYDYFGTSVSISGDTLAVGKADISDFEDPGAVYVYQMNSGGANNWGQVKKIGPPSGATQFGRFVSICGDMLAVCKSAEPAYLFSRNSGGMDNWGLCGSLPAEDDAAYGRSICLSGSTVLVGDFSYGSSPSACGAVFVYDLSRDWKDRKLRVDANPQAGDGMGHSVSQWQEFTAVGVPWKDPGGRTDAGAVIIYKRNSSTAADAWVAVKTILPSDSSALDYFGFSVSLSDGYLAVGAIGDDDLGTNSGAVYIFSRNWGGPDNWGQVEKLTASGGTAYDMFGSAVSLNGDTVAVGAPDKGPGMVFLFKRNQGGADRWGQIRSLDFAPAQDGDSYGYALSLLGDTLAVGAPYQTWESEIPESGVVHIYYRNIGGSENWGRAFSRYGVDANGRFGNSVSLWGDSLAVGAPTSTNWGRVYIFDRNAAGADAWGCTAWIENPSASSQIFGRSVSLWGKFIAVGDGRPSFDPMVYIYRRTGNTWGFFALLEPGDNDPYWSLGQSLSLYDKYLAVGAPYHDVYADEAGAVYWFYNHWPVAVADTYEAYRNIGVTVAAPGVFANDLDENGDSFALDWLAYPAHGTLTPALGGGFTYIPVPGYTGSDSFEYTISDGMESSDWVAVNLNVVNRAPAAYGDGYETNRNTQLVVSAPGVLTNDTDLDTDTLTAVKDSDPSNGSVILNSDGSFTYTPTLGYYGSDSFTYHANDGLADSGIRQVSISVINHAPVAVNDNYGTGIGVQLNVPAPGVLGNDTDGDGDALSALKNGDPSHGTVTLNVDGSFTYTPTGGYSGLDTFTYHARDGLADSNVATVTINVSNQPPTANPDSYTAYCGIQLVVDAPGILGNDTDPESDPLLAMINTLPAHGTLAPNQNGSFTYTPTPGYSGPDSFTYHAYDGWNSSSVVTVSITVESAADLSITKTDSPDPLCPNATLTYTLTVHNGGFCGATGIVLTDNLDISVSNPVATPSQGSCQVDGTTVTCNLGSLAASANATVTITCQPTMSGEVPNWAYVSHGEYDPDMYNDNTSISTTVLMTSPTPPMMVTVTDLDPCLLNGVSVAWEPEVSATGYDLMAGSTLVENVTSPYTYVPGDNSLRFYKIRSKTQCGAGDWSGNYPGTDSYFVPNQAVIDQITDDDPCAYGITIGFSGGIPSNKWELLRDGVVVVSPWETNQYYPGDSLPHSYVVRSYYNACYSDSAPYVFADTNNSPSMPALGSIAEVDACVQNGVIVNFTGGSPATSHSLLVDNVEVATSVTSPVTYNPGDTSTHGYKIRTYNGACYTQGPAIGYADMVNAKPSAPSLSTVVDNDTCMPTGVTVTFTTGSPATSHSLLQDGAVVATNISSPYSYSPPDLNAHLFAVRAINDGCYTDSNVVSGQDQANLSSPLITGEHENLCPSHEVSLETEPGMSNYQWTLDFAPISGATTSALTATASGTYGVTYTNGSGCTNPSGPHWVQINGCPSTPPPVPDGRNSTVAAQFESNPYIPEEIEVTYATAPCSGEQAVVLYGTIGNFTEYSGCAQDNAGSTGVAYFDSTGMDNVWFNILWTNGGIAGHPGFMYVGGSYIDRSMLANGFCGIYSDDQTDGTCD